MTVLLGEATADFFIERSLILEKGHGAEDTFEAHEGMIGGGSTALEYIVAALAPHDNGIAAICGLACFAKATQEFGNCSFHVNLTIRLGDSVQCSHASKVATNLSLKRLVLAPVVHMVWRHRDSCCLDTSECFS